jgi:hypothetical protein
MSATTYVLTTMAGRGRSMRSSSPATRGDMTKESSHARKRIRKMVAKPPSTASRRSASRKAK